MIILTHRGLEPSRENAPPESSYEAFKNHLDLGYGIEFDPNFIKDEVVVSHDTDLKRITGGLDNRKFNELALEEVQRIKYGWRSLGRIPTLEEIFGLIIKSKSKINAMHVKGINQTRDKIDSLLKKIWRYPGVINKLILFDIKPETARYIKEKIPTLKLAPSVAHDFDIKRYNDCVNGTLISIDDAIAYKKGELYDWVWLDEWDLNDEDNKKKKFYTKENFDILREVGYKIGLVTPELHGISPGLLGGEMHQESKKLGTLFKRIEEIIGLKPDAICTDYPNEVKEMLPAP